MYTKLLGFIHICHSLQVLTMHEQYPFSKGRMSLTVHKQNVQKKHNIQQGTRTESRIQVNDDIH